MHLGELIACGRIDGTGAAPGLASAAGFFQRGCAVTRPGAQHSGIYTVTLDRAVNNDQAVMFVETETGGMTCQATQPAGGATRTVTTRTVANPTAAEDAIFQFAIFKVAGGGGSTGL